MDASLTNIGSYKVVERVYCRKYRSAIYKVEDAQGRQAAIKLGRRPRIEAEYAFLRTYNNPHIVQAQDSSLSFFDGQADDVFPDEKSGLSYFAMEFLNGELLQTKDNYKKHNPILAINQMLAIANALLLTWANNNFHGDIKPLNIMDVAQRGWVLFDLEIGAAYREGLVGGDIISGTLHFLPPEDARFYVEYGSSRDLYAIALTLYRLMIGHHLWRNDFDFRPSSAEYDLNTYRRYVEDFDYAAAFADPLIPTPLADFLFKATRPKLDERLHDPAAFVNELSAVSQTLGGS